MPSNKTIGATNMGERIFKSIGCGMIRLSGGTGHGRDGRVNEEEIELQFR